MKFTQQVEVTGLKRSKGNLENGTAYDSTKAFVIIDMDGSKGDAVGRSAEAFNIGLSDEFEFWKGQQFPCMATADFELVTNGSQTKTLIRRLVPLAPKKV